MEQTNIRDRFHMVRENVLQLLIEYPECRSDNFTLVLKYWQVFNGVKINIPVEVRDALTRYETIIRRKQEIQMDEERFKSVIPSSHKYKKLTQIHSC